MAGDHALLGIYMRARVCVRAHAAGARKAPRIRDPTRGRTLQAVVVYGAAGGGRSSRVAVARLSHREASQS